MKVGMRKLSPCSTNEMQGKISYEAYTIGKYYKVPVFQNDSQQVTVKCREVCGH
jgi:hypothetical protein